MLVSVHFKLLSRNFILSVEWSCFIVVHVHHILLFLELQVIVVLEFLGHVICVEHSVSK